MAPDRMLVACSFQTLSLHAGDEHGEEYFGDTRERAQSRAVCAGAAIGFSSPGRLLIHPALHEVLQKFLLFLATWPSTFQVLLQCPYI